ncbi:hypothetical protein [Puia dinghuensis]|uniref:Uncharacterized protein n=1 Tax=Puia dinghuensis TaxID=1792502 RepID=A0A8J2UB35_9BACT|nr:hypothetical protein [Puia dinghuensis]GGA92612.1 hypothetical protein GCM10011511_14990 [Puia dinghuensis]
MEKQLSDSLLNRIRETLRQTPPPKLYWDYGDHLTPEQINKLLVLPDGLQQVEQEILEDYWEYADQRLKEQTLETLNNQREAIADEWGLNAASLSDDQLKYMIEEYDLHTEVPGTDPNLSPRIRNCRPRIVFQLDVDHPYEGWQWRRTVRYDEVKEALRLFNVNPRKIHPQFPNLPYRDGKEYILPKDLMELWDNAPYGGRYVMPINLNLSDYLKDLDHYQTGVILHKGGEIWMHDYGNGSGSISVPLQKDLKIMRKKLAYFLSDDNNTAGYGLDEVYGLCQSAWRNSLSPVKTAHPQTYTLPAVDKVYGVFFCGLAYTDNQTSANIRAFTNVDAYRRDKAPLPGELMDWDMNRLWKDFPSSGINYLRKEADRNAAHYVFKVKEIIGQALIVHCQLIVHDPSRKIVWSNVSENERSYAVFEWVKEKIAKSITSHPLPEPEKG